MTYEVEHKNKTKLNIIVSYLAKIEGKKAMVIYQISMTCEKQKYKIDT